MASSSFLNTQEAIDLNDVPSVMHAPSSMPEVWRPYFLSLNDPVTCVASISNMGRRLHVRNHEVQALRSQVTILQRLLKENKKKVGEFKEENKRLKKLVDSYTNDLLTRSTE
uniref:Uncharacterized protein n=1 Tax=Fagus sylvatica TaxID=28930 RepID=A0A2N9GAA1_FAGSY